MANALLCCQNKKAIGTQMCVMCLNCHCTYYVQLSNCSWSIQMNELCDPKRKSVGENQIAGDEQTCTAFNLCVYKMVIHFYTHKLRGTKSSLVAHIHHPFSVCPPVFTSHALKLACGVLYGCVFKKCGVVCVCCSVCVVRSP